MYTVLILIQYNFALPAQSQYMQLNGQTVWNSGFFLSGNSLMYSIANMQTLRIIYLFNSFCRSCLRFCIFSSVGLLLLISIQTSFWFHITLGFFLQNNRIKCQLKYIHVQNLKGCCFFAYSCNVVILIWGNFLRFQKS